MTEPTKAPPPTARPPRKFAVEPVEESHRTNRRQKEEGDTTKPRRRFVPQLEETSTKHVRKGDGQSTRPQVTVSPPKEESKAIVVKDPVRKTKFAPQLIETTKRSRRKGDPLPAHKYTDKTDLSPGDNEHLPRHMRLTRPTLPVPPANTPSGSSNEIPTESRFSAAQLAKKAPRRTSFRTPELPPISSQPESDETEESKVPSLSTTPSAASEDLEGPKHSKRVRESCDDRFSGYLLSLAAQVAEKQLKEQAMAAYPNEKMHEPVDHFAVDRDSEVDSDDGVHFSLLSPQKSNEEKGMRRESAAGWEVEEMQRHKEKLERQRKRHQETEADIAAVIKRMNKINAASEVIQLPFSNPYASALPKHDDGFSELKKMRSAASPPMLGGDLVFPKSLSPKATHIDATQKPRSHRNANTKNKASGSRDRSGLWTPCAGLSPVATRKNSAAEGVCGLWNGVCTTLTNHHLCPPIGRLFQSGLRTPAREVGDPLSSTLVTSSESERKLLHLAATQSSEDTAPSSPVASPVTDSCSVPAITTDLEAHLDAEFPDSFVTQIYNYLSLGYPALARHYDHELSKISGVAVEEIRKDDGNANGRGFISMHLEGDEDIGEKSCSRGREGARWTALRLYIREWGRQEGRMKGEADVLEKWGQTARRGSWAI